jgi:hypothetical protein
VYQRRVQQVLGMVFFFFFFFEETKSQQFI